MNTERPQAVTVAAVLLALMSALGVTTAFVPALTSGVPAVVVYGSAVLGVVGLVAAYGLWRLKRWSVWLAIVVSLLGALSAAPGIAAAPTTLLFVLAAVGTAANVLIIVLAMLPASRRAYA